MILILIFYHIFIGLLSISNIATLSLKEGNLKWYFGILASVVFVIMRFNVLRMLGLICFFYYLTIPVTYFIDVNYNYDLKKEK